MRAELKEAGYSMRELTRYGNWLVTKSYGENTVEFR